jgi:hypothetical protein
MRHDFKVKAFIPVVVMREAAASLRRRLKHHLFYAKFAAYPMLAESPGPAKPRPRVLAAVVHITSQQEHDDRDAAAVKVERLVATLDGLLCSFAHCDVTVLIVTMTGRHVVHFLPDHLSSIVELHLVEGGDPMLIGFPAQDALIARREAHDWFVFLEDDIEIRDSAFLDKVSRFCALPGMEHCVLMPNRYEYVHRVKRYIDLTHLADMIEWNRLSRIKHDDNVMAECVNPHAGMYCLSRSQIDRLVASGRDWRGRDIFGGPRESAATFNLLECFRLFKPHPDNFYYLEVRHVDSKYSLMHPAVSSYTYTAIADQRGAAP